MSCVGCFVDLFRGEDGVGYWSSDDAGVLRGGGGR